MTGASLKITNWLNLYNKTIPAFLQSHTSHNYSLLTKSEIFIVKHIRSGANGIRNIVVNNKQVNYLFKANKIYYILLVLTKAEEPKDLEKA